MINVRPLAAIALTALFASVPVLITPVGAEQYSERTKQVGSKIKCMCRGCDMPAATCSHPGGAFSGPCETAKMMLGEVDQHIAKGETDEQVLQAFVQEYGTQVYADPPKSGFSLVAWALPSIYLFAGTAVVILVILRWRKRPAQEFGPAHGAPGIPAELLERARARASRETQD
ncbi:MAG TPA: cytochrome c-type biogenesis protein CcmH [Candidatus Acidoferrum sp.]|nr:cytochrome c-type biogenesis protein CcmH [Candidatus Acidoferrum sp.]